MSKIQIILGSTRQNRLSEKVGKWLLKLLNEKENIEAEILDLREYPLPFYNEPAPAAALNRNYSNPEVQKWSQKVMEGDGYIIISPEYNHSFPAVLKNALDSLYSEWNHKPVGIVSYGGVGGARSIEHLRGVLSVLDMIALSKHLTIFNAHQIFENDQPQIDEKLAQFADTLIKDLIDYTELFKEFRAKRS